MSVSLGFSNCLILLKKRLKPNELDIDTLSELIELLNRGDDRTIICALNLIFSGIRNNTNNLIFARSLPNLLKSLDILLSNVLSIRDKTKQNLVLLACIMQLLSKFMINAEPDYIKNVRNLPNLLKSLDSLLLNGDDKIKQNVIHLLDKLMINAEPDYIKNVCNLPNLLKSLDILLLNGCDKTKLTVIRLLGRLMMNDYSYYKQNIGWGDFEQNVRNLPNLHGGVCILLSNGNEITKQNVMHLLFKIIYADNEEGKTMFVQINNSIPNLLTELDKLLLNEFNQVDIVLDILAHLVMTDISRRDVGENVRNLPNLLKRLDSLLSNKSVVIQIPVLNLLDNLMEGSKEDFKENVRNLSNLFIASESLLSSAICDESKFNVIEHLHEIGKNADPVFYQNMRNLPNLLTEMDSQVLNGHEYEKQTIMNLLVMLMNDALIMGEYCSCFIMDNFGKSHQLVYQDFLKNINKKHPNLFKEMNRLFSERFGLSFVGTKHKRDDDETSSASKKSKQEDKL